MASSQKRERQLARERYERQQARRRASAQRRRKLQQGGAVAFAVLLVVAGVVFLAVMLEGEEGTVATENPGAAGSATASVSPSTDESPSPSASPAADGCTFTETAAEPARQVQPPDAEAAADTQPYTATITTAQGFEVVIDVAADVAPCTAASFASLAEQEYFAETPCHRLTTANIFVLQCGDPTGTGGGGPGYEFGEENLPADEENNYPAGTVAMANAGPGTNGSQFFLVYEDTTLPPAYSVFGTITSGLDAIVKVAEAGVEGGGSDGRPQQPVTIDQVRTGSA